MIGRANDCIRWWLAAILLFSPVLPGGARAAEPGGADESLLARAKRIHRQALIIDTHVDIAGPQYATAELDPGVCNPALQCDLVKMAEGGIDGVFLAVWVGQGRRDREGYRHAYETALAKFKAIHRLADAMYPDRCQLATSPEEVQRIVASGKRAIMIGIENGYPIGTDLANLRRFYDLGARYITLSHNGHNQICDSCIPRPKLGDRPSEHNGLSEFGRQVVAEMNRLGIMIDVSHIAPQSFWDVIGLSRAPVIASHSACRALRDHPRNLDDRQLRALADHGGVVQIVLVAGFLKAPSAERRRAINALAEQIGIPTGPDGPKLAQARDEQREQFRKGMKEVDGRYPLATVKDLADHIDHAVRVAGVDHVGVGTDFDGGGGIQGFQNHAQALNLTIELLRRGYSEEAIKKIWGGNLLRVWRCVERVAAEAPEQAGR